MIASRIAFVSLYALFVASACTLSYEHGQQASLDTAQLVFEEYSAALDWYNALPPERQAHYFPLMEDAWMVTFQLQKAALAWQLEGAPPADYSGVLAQALELIETLRSMRGLEDGR